MKYRIKLYLIIIFLLSGILIMTLPIVYANSDNSTIIKILSAYNSHMDYKKISIVYPFDNTLFPADIASPEFQWVDRFEKCNLWFINMQKQSNESILFYLTEKNSWKPAPEVWESIKLKANYGNVIVTILGINSKQQVKIVSKAIFSFRISSDKVEAPIFYREVNLPFIDAFKDTTNIFWRLGKVSSHSLPPHVLKNVRVCIGCHSFSANGKYFGQDVDYNGDKSSYAIAKVAPETVIDKNNIISWSKYNKSTLATLSLFPKISPNGKYAIATAKELILFVPFDDLTISQTFYPVRGILIVYDRLKETFNALKGADDERFVQTNVEWSPDGKYIVFARSKAYHPKSYQNPKLWSLNKNDTQFLMSNGKNMLFDLYRVPFNNGKGGLAEPLIGASNNGMSNYYPRFSPDGKWIVFCKSITTMNLQADSQLYIIPASGGEPRKMNCNTKFMNSWHSWSPNGKWMVFSSKMNGPFTQLFLTHIDEKGYDTPPVLLSNFNSPNMAANLPEFVNFDSDAMKKITLQFLKTN